MPQLKRHYCHKFLFFSFFLSLLVHQEENSLREELTHETWCLVKISLVNSISLSCIISNQAFAYIHTVWKSVCLLYLTLIFNAAFRFLGHENKDTFFKTTQRHQIVSFESLFLKMKSALRILFVCLFVWLINVTHIGVYTDICCCALHCVKHFQFPKSLLKQPNWRENCIPWFIYFTN